MKIWELRVFCYEEIFAFLAYFFTSIIELVTDITIKFCENYYFIINTYQILNSLKYFIQKLKKNVYILIK